jgi:hypothetical protein
VKGAASDNFLRNSLPHFVNALLNAGLPPDLASCSPCLFCKHLVQSYRSISALASGLLKALAEAVAQGRFESLKITL